MYRINFGNGQVSRTFRSITEANRELIGDTFEHIQRYEGDGMWVRVKERR